MRGAIAGVLGPNGRPARAEDLSHLGSWLGHRGAHLDVRRADRGGAFGLVQRSDDETRVGWLAADGSRAAAVHTGKILNGEELRRMLRARGHPLTPDDTLNRVLAAGYREWRQQLVERLRGSFALCCVDLEARRVLLACDPLGTQRLYFAGPGFFEAGAQPRLAFATELRALATLQHARPRLSELSFRRYLALHHVPAPDTIWNHALVLPGGGSLELNLDDDAEEPSRGRIRRYWSPRFDALDAPETRKPSARRRALRDALDDTLAEWTSGRRDVGVLLTGGLDSSLVAALATRHAPTVHTFGLSFRDRLLDESGYARRVARHLNTSHTEQVVDERSMATALEDAAASLDQPVVDPGVVGTLALARLARRHDSIVLTGDGADDVFLGHPRLLAERLRPRALDRVPKALGRMLGTWTDEHPLIRQHALASGMSRELLRTLRGREDDAAFRPLEELQAEALHAGARDVWDTLSFGALRVGVQTHVVPRLELAAAASQLQAYAPLLDPRVVDVGLALRGRERIAGLVTKAPLREAARGLLPDPIVERPPRHVVMQVTSLLGGGRARALLDELLLSPHVATKGLLDARACRTLLSDHLAGRPRRVGAVLPLVFFSLWLRRAFEQPQAKAP